jgi:hypothetical protein
MNCEVNSANELSGKLSVSYLTTKENLWVNDQMTKLKKKKKPVG